MARGLFASLTCHIKFDWQTSPPMYAHENHQSSIVDTLSTCFYCVLTIISSDYNVFGVGVPICEVHKNIK